MKKIRYLLLLCLFMIISTGCVKFNATMDIKKDKSMEFSIIYALDKTYFSGDKAIKEEDFQELKKEGFTVTPYSNGNMEGFTISKKFANIDDVSTDKESEYNLSGMMKGGDGNKYIFKVEKGLLKNTYTAVIKFDSNDSGLNTSTIEENENLDDTAVTPDEKDELTITATDEEITTTGSEDFTITSSDGTSLDDLDYSSAMANMDMSFNVNLPYAAISHNATKTDNGNKKLSWTLLATSASDINFKFAIYNMTIIYIGVGVLLAIIILIVLLIVKSKGKNKAVVVNDTQIEIKNEPVSNIVSEPRQEKEVNVMNNEQEISFK